MSVARARARGRFGRGREGMKGARRLFTTRCSAVSTVPERTRVRPLDPLRSYESPRSRTSAIRAVSTAIGFWVTVERERAVEVSGQITAPGRSTQLTVRSEDTKSPSTNLQVRACIPALPLTEMCMLRPALLHVIGPDAHVSCAARPGLWIRPGSAVDTLRANVSDIIEGSRFGQRPALCRKRQNCA